MQQGTDADPDFMVGLDSTLPDVNFGVEQQEAPPVSLTEKVPRSQRFYRPDSSVRQLIPQPPKGVKRDQKEYGMSRADRRRKAKFDRLALKRKKSDDFKAEAGISQ